MKTLRLAILMTCHNRHLTTLACLAALFRQQTELPLVNLQVYLVDDGSTDGTALAVQANYPQVKVLQGTGNLFWNGGMSLAFAEAMKEDYDYYFWLNDDTLLYPQALATSLATSQQLIDQGHTCAVVVGSVQDPQSGTLSYGGMKKSSWWHPLKFQLVAPSSSAKPCATLNGNCILIPRSVAAAIGNLDPHFVHSTGDLDYGLRVWQQKGSVWIAPGFLGSCQYNPLRHQAWEQANLTLRERWHRINEPRGLPLQEWKVFAQRHAGALWMFYWLLPYIRLLGSTLLRPAPRQPTSSL